MRGFNLMVNPTRDLFDWSREWENFFDGGKAGSVRQFVPAVDVEEDETHYLVNVEIPGVAKDNIKIEIKDSVLSISGEKKFERTEKNKNYYLSERSSGRFERRFTLPENVDADRVEAIHADGVLKVSIPKAEAAKPKVISIKAN